MQLPSLLDVPQCLPFSLTLSVWYWAVGLLELFLLEVAGVNRLDESGVCGS